MRNKIACISLNLDSIGHAIGKSPLENDPTFNIVFDRIEKILDRYNIKLSVFVIGKDLENDKNLKKVSSWSSRGHEIGNHTYSHALNFSSLSYKEIHNEIKKTDELILKATNKKPTGFIAPGWNSSNKVLLALKDLGYKYDHSLFSSPILFLGLFKLFYNFIKVLIVEKKQPKTYTIFEIFQRRDYLHMFFGKSKPFKTSNSYFFTSKEKDALRVYPIPSKFKLAYWLTMDFVLPKKISDLIFKINIKRKNFFYILIHPADFISEEDLRHIEGTHSFERISVDLDYKLNVFEDRIKQLLENNFIFKTFDQLT